ncbi:heterokaryon incompatibility protein-domain-containing protein [Trametes polyzona]|nr:heterokaryon incompatibility protein-domain-containing protein [Trametes polyzona]
MWPFSNMIFTLKSLVRKRRRHHPASDPQARRSSSWQFVNPSQSSLPPHAPRLSEDGDQPMVHGSNAQDDEQISSEGGNHYWVGPVASASVMRCKPSKICGDCWRGPCAVQFGLGFYKPFMFHLRESFGYTYSVSWGTLVAGARSGCVWCAFVLRSRPTVESDPDQERLPSDRLFVSLGWRTFEESRRSQMVVSIRGIGSASPAWRVQSYSHVWVPADTHIPSSPSPRPFVMDVRSAHAFSLAKICLRACVNGEFEHLDCQAFSPPPGSGPLPSRLIDCANASYPRLTKTTGKKCAPYLALSYVWGPSSAQQHCRTTRANIKTYTMDGIPVSTLPQTIRDAIYLTRALGFRYLWIDSLCIIQDSARDKHQEMSRMRDVYRHAYLTIIAASASSATEGFLLDRPIPHSSESTTTIDLPIALQRPRQEDPFSLEESVQWRAGSLRLAPVFIEPSPRSEPFYESRQ